MGRILIVMRLQSIWCGLLGVLAVVAVAGCGAGGSTVVTGKVLDGGSPLVYNDSEYVEGEWDGDVNCVEVLFVPVDAQDANIEGGKVHSEVVQEDGTFTMIEHPEHGAMEPGRYRIALRCWVASDEILEDDDDDDGGGEEEGRYDSWEGKYDEDNSPFIRDVKLGDELVIDISKTEG
jgi:hypothetical protein